MKKPTLAKLMAALLLCAGVNTAAAQMIAYTGCAVREPNSVIAALNSFWEAMSTPESAGRPTLMLSEALFNGPAPGTHSLAAQYADYAAYEASRARIAAKPGVWTALVNSVSAVADCPTDGLFVQMESWGDMDADWTHYAVYPFRTTDIRAYIKAFDKFANSKTMESAPGPVVLWENRAGGQGASHFVNFHAPSFAELNSFLDSLLDSEDYADFVDDVASIRTLGVALQYRKVMMWEP